MGDIVPVKIKDLQHALELYNQGILVPMRSVLVDGNGDERVFLGFNLKGNLMFTLDRVNEEVSVWRNLDLLDYDFHIKPKTKIVTFWKRLDSSNHNRCEETTGYYSDCGLRYIGNGKTCLDLIYYNYEKTEFKIIREVECGK